MTAAGSAEPSLPGKVIAIHEALSGMKIGHAFGGALALAYYAEPRATIDIDLNLFLAAEGWEPVVGALGAIGVDADGFEPDALLRDGQCRLWWGDNPVDLFFAYDEIHDAMRAEARRVPFAETKIPILAPEHLVVCKAILDRNKDWIDIEQVLVATEDLDVAEIEQWLDRLVGAGDSRWKRLAELKTRLQLDS